MFTMVDNGWLKSIRLANGYELGTDIVGAGVTPTEGETVAGSLQNKTSKTIFKNHNASFLLKAITLQG